METVKHIIWIAVLSVLIVAVAVYALCSRMTPFEKCGFMFWYGGGVIVCAFYFWNYWREWR